MASIVFRAACDYPIGTGHLRRCLTLARELRSRGALARLVSDDNPTARSVLDGVDDVPYLLIAEGCPLATSTDEAAVFVIDRPAGPRGVNSSPQLEQEIAELDRAGIAVVSIGHSIADSGHLRAVVDLYPAQQLAAANYVEGPDYLILRPEFQAVGTRHVQREDAVLVAMGGTDPLDLTMTALKALSRSELSSTVHVVVGMGHRASSEALETAATKLGLKAHVHRELDAESLATLMLRCRAAVVAFGTLAYELMALGVPVLSLTHYCWQQPSAAFFGQLGSLVDLGCAEAGINIEELAERLRAVLDDTVGLDKLALRGPQVVDGAGAERVATMLETFMVESQDRELDDLYVLAHPGDEVFGCGGSILRKTAVGRRVGVVILGEGTASRHGIAVSSSQEHEWRLETASSLQKVTEGLGIKTLYYFRYPDNRFDGLNLLDLVKSVETVVQRHQPTTVVTHHPADLNIDHRLTFEAVAVATRPTAETSVERLVSAEVPSSSDWGLASPSRSFYPNLFVDISSVLEIKLRLAALYRSEIRASPHPQSLDGLRARAHYWGHLTGLAAAEAFVSHRHIEREL